MTSTVLDENEAARLERLRWFVRGVAVSGLVTPEMASTMDKATDHLAGQVTASAILNGKEASHGQ